MARDILTRVDRHVCCVDRQLYAVSGTPPRSRVCRSIWGHTILTVYTPLRPTGSSSTRLYSLEQAMHLDNRKLARGSPVAGRFETRSLVPKKPKYCDCYTGLALGPRLSVSQSLTHS